MTKRKMPAVLLAGLMILALAGCNANKATPDSGTAADSRITETVTNFTPATTVDTALPADTENKTEATAEKKKRKVLPLPKAAPQRKPESLRKVRTRRKLYRRRKHQSRANRRKQPSRSRPSRLRSPPNRSPPNRSPPNLLQRSRRRASPRPTITASYPRLRLMPKATRQRASPSCGRTAWNSAGMWVGWEHPVSAVTVWTVQSRPSSIMSISSTNPAPTRQTA